MTSVFIVAHHERAEAATLARTAMVWLLEHGHQAWMSPDDAEALSLGEFGSDRSPRDAGLSISLGGDGTMLRTVQLLDGAPVPVIGVNVGVLGYLTEIDPPALLPALERWFGDGDGAHKAAHHAEYDGGQHSSSGDWRIDERMLLQLVVERVGADNPSERWRALNEVVLEKGESGHTVRLLVSIDGAPFTSYAADGLIVATPTGSTAYSLSARGPVVSPHLRAMLLTPVSPHMLFDRSLVLDPSEVVRIEVTGYRPVEVSVDGQRVATLAEGDVLQCFPAAETAQFVRFGPRRFHQILKGKFGLTDR